MVSRILRRSGKAVLQIAEQLDNWKPDTIIQVGVGLNHQEVDCFKEAWPNVHMIGFEANPKIVESIKNKYPGDLYNLAICDYIGTAIIHSPQRWKDGSQLSESEGAQYTVKASTLDEKIIEDPWWFEQKDEQMMLWLDCEGSELKAMQGGPRLLKHIQVVNIEMTAKPRVPGWPETVRVHRHLVEAGFYHQWSHTGRICIGQYDAVYVRPELFKPEYCCCPYEIDRYNTRGDCKHPTWNR